MASVRIFTLENISLAAIGVGLVVHEIRRNWSHEEIPMAKDAGRLRRLLAAWPAILMVVGGLIYLGTQLFIEPITVRIEQQSFPDEPSGAPDLNQQYVSQCRHDEIVIGGTCEVQSGLGTLQNTKIDLASRTFRCVYTDTREFPGRNRVFSAKAYATCLKAR